MLLGPEHLRQPPGLDGIDSRGADGGSEGLVARAARRPAVLNADDALCLAIRTFRHNVSAW